MLRNGLGRSGRVGGRTFNEVEGAVCPEVGGEKFVYGPAFDNGAFMNDPQADAFHQVTKIAHRHKVDVGGFVPFPGESFGYRSSAAAEHFEAYPPVSEVGDDNQTTSGHAEHFRKQSAGISDLLECLAEDCEIEGVAGDVFETAVEVSLNGRKAALNHPDEVILFNFDAEHIAGGFFVEAFEQSPIAAAEVDYPTSASNMLHDEFVREADGRVWYLVARAL